MKMKTIFDDREKVLQDYIKKAVGVYAHLINEDNDEANKHAKEVLYKLIHTLELLASSSIYKNELRQTFTLGDLLDIYVTDRVTIDLGSECLEGVDSWIIDDISEGIKIMDKEEDIYQKLCIEDHVIRYVRLDDLTFNILVSKINDLYTKTTYHFTDFNMSTPNSYYWESFRAGQQLLETLKYICKFRYEGIIRDAFEDNIIISKLVDIIYNRYFISDAIISELFWFNEIIYNHSYAKRDILEEVSSNISSCLNNSRLGSIESGLGNDRHTLYNYVNMIRRVRTYTGDLVVSAPYKIPEFLRVVNECIDEFKKGYAYTAVKHLTHNAEKHMAIHEILETEARSSMIIKFIRVLHHDKAADILAEMVRIIESGVEIKSLKQYKVYTLQKFLNFMEEIRVSKVSINRRINVIEAFNLPITSCDELLSLQDDAKGEVLEFIQETSNKFHDQDKFIDIATFIKYRESKKILREG